MRRFLLVCVVVEALALVAAAALSFSADDLQVEVPEAPVFRPPILDARPGDEVTYDLKDQKTGQYLGRLTYKLQREIVYKGTTQGPELWLHVTRTNAAGAPKDRLLLHQIYIHGFLPPAYDEDILPPGEHPVVKSIRSTDLTLHNGKRVPGFLVEAVRPRWSLTQVRDRYWLSSEVPLFGVFRAERDGVVWELQGSSRASQKGSP